MPDTYELIKTTTLASNSAEIGFTSIPQTFQHLIISFTVKSTNEAQTDSMLYYAGTTTEGQSYGRLTIRTGIQNYGLVTSEQGPMRVTITPITTTSSTNSTANTWTTGRIFIPNYSITNRVKQGFCNHQTTFTNNSSANQIFTGFFSEGSNPLQNIYFRCASGIYATGTSISLYGLKTS